MERTESRPTTPASEQDVTAVSPQTSTDNAAPEPSTSTEEVNMDIDPPMETESMNTEQEQNENEENNGATAPARTPTPPQQTPYNLRPRREPPLYREDESDTDPQDQVTPVTPTRTPTPPPPLPPFWKKPRRPPPPIPTTPGGTPFPPFDQSTLRPAQNAPKTPEVANDSPEEETQTGVVIGNPYNRPIIPKVTRDPAPLDPSIQGPASGTRSRTSYPSPKCTKRPRPESSDEESEPLIPTKKVHVQSSNYPVSDESHWKYPPLAEREVRIETPTATEGVQNTEKETEEIMDISSLETIKTRGKTLPKATLDDPVQRRKRKFEAIRRFTSSLATPYGLLKAIGH